jgi:beta-glucosidase
MKNTTLLSILGLLLLLTACKSPRQPVSSYAYPFQDPSMDIDDRVSDLVSRLSIDEKVNQLFNKAPAIERLEIPEYNWWNECLHGVARAGEATVFPQAIGLAATFDEDLMFRVATAISDEGRAKHHYFARNGARGIYMGLTYWSPNINIFRDPRWGRGQETYGEDPYLTGRLAVNFVNGLQGDHPRYLKSIATVKHYAVHSGPEFTRHVDNIFINDRDLYETYLPAFKMAIEEANVQSVMCAYNRFRDQPCCGSNLLLGSILRQEFGFSGYVVTDCGAVTDFYGEGYHEVVETPEQAWGWSLATGADLNCEESRAFLENIDSALHVGIVNEKDINTSLSRLFKARFQLGFFDPEELNPYTDIPMSVVGSEEHLKLSLEAAEKSMVLLKNDGILPLEKDKKIALIGPNANNFDILIGNYNGDPILPLTPLDGFREVLKDQLVYTPGSPLVPGIYSDFRPVGQEMFYHYSEGELEPGLLGSYFSNTDFSGEPASQKIDPSIDLRWEFSPSTGVMDEPFSVKWEGVLKPEHTGDYVFDGNVSLILDNIPVSTQKVHLVAGKEYKLEARHVAEAFWWSSNYQQQFAKLSWFDASRDLEAEALQAASEADVIVFCGGISSRLEGEQMPMETDGFAHGDRTHIRLPAVQEDLLKKLHQTGKPIVYVNFSGSAIALNWQEENLPAIIQAFYPGEATGHALTRIIYGETNPSGRLPVTFYRSIEDLPGFLNYQMEGRTYRYFRGEPLYEFGYGLSYTRFEYSKLVLPDKVEIGEPVTLSVEVRNSGNRDGREVVQLYISDELASVPVPVRTLAGIQPVFLKAGETTTLSFDVDSDQFSLIDENYMRKVEPGDFLISVGGSQPGDEALAKGKAVTGRISVQ